MSLNAPYTMPTGAAPAARTRGPARLLQPAAHP